MWAHTLAPFLKDPSWINSTWNMQEFQPSFLLFFNLDFVKLKFSDVGEAVLKEKFVNTIDECLDTLLTSACVTVPQM